MRKLTLLFLTFCIGIYTNAATITVSNNPNTPGQYSDLQVAINAAASGDIILVAGSPISYGSVTINNKAIHLKGIGYNPNKQTPYNAQLGICIFGSLNYTINSSGSSIEGFYINGGGSGISLQGVINDPTHTALSNITIKRCDLSSINLYGKVSDILIYNNLINSFHKDNTYPTKTNNIIFSNNIVTGGIAYEAYFQTPYNTGTIIINNNLFINNFSLNNIYNGNFSNNIFYGFSPNATTLEYCNFSYNLSYGAIDNNFNTTGTNGGGNNLVAQNPNFVNELDYLFDNTDDFHFPVTSPAYHAGSAGTDIGIYGGTYPWPDGGISGSGFMYSQEPQIPQVNQMSIANTMVPVGGNINVTAKGIVNH